MKVEAIDIRKGTGFNKVQRILQNNVKYCVMIGLVLRQKLSPKIIWQAIKKFTKN